MSLRDVHSGVSVRLLNGHARDVNSESTEKHGSDELKHAM